MTYQYQRTAALAALLAALGIACFLAVMFFYTPDWGPGPVAVLMLLCGSFVGAGVGALFNRPFVGAAIGFTIMVAVLVLGSQPRDE